MTAPADSSIQTNVLPIDHTLFVFSFIFFSFFINNCNHSSLLRKCLKMKIFLLFTNIYSKINRNVVKTISPQHYLPMHIRENIDFRWQKPRQLPSAEENFEG